MDNDKLNRALEDVANNKFINHTNDVRIALLAHKIYTVPHSDSRCDTLKNVSLSDKNKLRQLFNEYSYKRTVLFLVILAVIIPVYYFIKFEKSSFILVTLLSVLILLFRYMFVTLKIKKIIRALK